MNNKLSVHVRENSKGKWWCNTTYNGYDYSVEEENITDAMLAFAAEIRKAGYLGELSYKPPVYYHQKENNQ